MKRSLKQYLSISLKGFAMGLVEPLPGISGGTVAFVTGVYEEFLGTIKGAFPALKQLLGKKPFQQRVTDFWTALNGNFLVALVAGMGIGVVLIAKFAKWMLENEKILFSAFIFGLIAASVWLVYKKVVKWTPLCYVLALAGLGLACLLPVAQPAGSEEFVPYGKMFAFSCVAACAFLMPGTSGSFFLYLFGAYYTLTHSIATFDITYLAVIGAGILTGMVAFSSFLTWLLKRYHDFTVSMMTGFIIGSLRIIWPWKEELETRMANALPDSYLLPLAACALGITIVFSINLAVKKLGKSKN